MRNQTQASSKNFPKLEYQLVKESGPTALKSFTPARLHSRITKIEKLLKTYRTKMKTQRRTTRAEAAGEKLEGRRLINYRMEHLNRSLGKYRDHLKSVESSEKTGRTATRKAEAKTTRRTSSARPAAARRKTAAKRQVAKTAGSRKATGSRDETSTKSALKARSSTSSRVNMKEDTDESKGLLPQSKMRLNRKGSGRRFRENQRQQSLQETEVNPARRNI